MKRNVHLQQNYGIYFYIRSKYPFFASHFHSLSASLLQSIWDDEGLFIDDNTLSVHISRLREKIGTAHIRTVRGIGYQWVEGG